MNTMNSELLKIKKLMNLNEASINKKEFIDEINEDEKENTDDVMTLSDIIKSEIQKNLRTDSDFAQSLLDNTEEK
jgi:hypothetical protein